MAPAPSGPLADIDSKQLQVQRTRRPLPKCPDEQLGFGKVITDHMLKVQWRSGKGWAAPQIVPSGPVGLHPFAHVFHYAIEAYEGMKAYVDDDGETRLFRPDMNMRRFNDSAARLCLPSFDGTELLECIKELLRVDKEWIPARRGYSMYLRPVIFSTTPWLGLTQCSEAMILVLMSPVGPYFKSGFVPIKLAVDAKYIRAWPGGTGDVKYGGNYGSTVISQRDAASGGASQSLYVCDVDEFVTEAGTMNIFFLWTNEEGVKELVTPTLEDGTILPGVTRRSVLDLAAEWNECAVVEKLLPFREVAAAFERDEVHEVFGTGTAAVIQPIGFIKYREKTYEVPKSAFEPGSFQLRLTNELYGIQYGKIPHPWSVVV